MPRLTKWAELIVGVVAVSAVIVAFAVGGVSDHEEPSTTATQTADADSAASASQSPSPALPDASLRPTVASLTEQSEQIPLSSGGTRLGDAAEVTDVQESGTAPQSPSLVRADVDTGVSKALPAEPVAALPIAADGQDLAQLLVERQRARGGPPLERGLEDIPASTFRDQLLALSPKGRAKALASFNRQRLPLISVPNLRIDNEDGVLHHVCDFSSSVPNLRGAAAIDAPMDEGAAEPLISSDPVAVSNPPAYNSKPNAPFTLYLHFNGGKISGMAWNTNRSVTEWDWAAWSTDGDVSTFSDAEQLAIYRIWQRVSEDFAPFDINVSTDVSFDPDSNGGPSNDIGWVFLLATMTKMEMPMLPEVAA